MGGMAFRTGSSAETTVGIVAFENVGDGKLTIELVERIEVGECGYGAVEEAGIGLAPLIALNCAIGKLQFQQNCIYVGAEEAITSSRSGSLH